MTDDIVTRLREEAMRPAIHEVCMAAASEIDQLRHDRIWLLDQLEKALRRIEDLKENDNVG